MTNLERISKNPTVQAWHQIFTLFGVPVILGISGFAAAQLFEIRDRLAVLETYERRIEAVEAWKESQQADALSHPRFDSRDGADLRAELKTEIRSLDRRVTRLEEQRDG